MAEALPSKEEIPHRQKTETYDFSDQFISLLHAGEQHSLGVWDKQVRLGSIKRRTEESVGPGQRSFHIIEITGNNSLSTYIVAPKLPYVGLNITLPNLVIVCKSIGRSFTFETQIEDEKGLKYRFRFSNSNLHIPRRTSYLTYIPMRLQDGWNDICVDLAHLADRVYGTKFARFSRIQIFASVRLQQVFFVNDDIWRGMAPVPAIKMMDNVHMIPMTHLPLVNPLWREPGSEQRQIPHIPDPLETARVTRAEAELTKRGASKIQLPPITPFYTPKSTDNTSTKPKKLVVSSKVSAKSLATSGTPTIAKENFLKLVVPEADEAMKLLNVVKSMHLDPTSNPTSASYIAALNILKEDDLRDKEKQFVKSIFPPGKGNVIKSMSANKPGTSTKLRKPIISKSASKTPKLPVSSSSKVEMKSENESTGTEPIEPTNTEKQENNSENQENN